MELFDIDLNFWEVYPSYKAIFYELYASDKTKSKKASSTIMWAIAHLIHPKSPIHSSSLQNKKDFILDTFKLNIDDYQDLTILFKESILTKAMKYLVSWEDKLEERFEFMDSYKYSEDTYEMLDKMMSNTDKLWSQYIKASKEVKEEEETSMKGDIVESLQERNLI